MSLIKPTITESLFYNFFKLEADRPLYYMAVYQVARNIFLNMNLPEKIQAMDKMIYEQLEKPLKSDFASIITAISNPRVMYSTHSYTLVGDGFDTIEISIYDIKTVIEKIKVWIYDEVIDLSQYVRFTRPSEIYG